MTPDSTTALQHALHAIYREGYAAGVASMQARCDSLEAVADVWQLSHPLFVGAFTGVSFFVAATLWLMSWLKGGRSS